MALCGSLPRLFARGSQTAAQRTPRSGPPNLRALRDEHVSSARERIFGLQGSMPGDRYFRKKLEGRQLMRWYFPSKFSLQDFRIDEYFEMQAERFAPREVHRCMPGLNVITQKVSKHREELRRFFNELDEHTFLNSPSLQDLYGVFRLVDSDHALSFPVPQSIFVEHSPMFGASPPFSLTAGNTQSSAPAREQGMSAELMALWALLKDKLKKGSPDGDSLALALDARIAQLQSEEDMRALLLETAHEHGIVAPFEQLSIVMEDAPYTVQRDNTTVQPDATLRQELSEGDNNTVQPDATLRQELSEDTESEDTDRNGQTSSSEDTDGESEDTEKAMVDAASTESIAGESLPPAGHMPQAGRKGVAIYLTRPEHGGSKEDRAVARASAEEELQSMRKDGSMPVRRYLERRHRFIDPMFRRRRLKWLERQTTGKNKETEVKFNTYYATHPDQAKEWPTNKGSVTVKWPSPHH